VNLAAHVNDGEEIAVPRLGEARSRASPRSRRHGAQAAGGRQTRRRPNRTPGGAGSAPSLAAPIDLNTAEEQSLAKLPGIGPTLAARIVQFRAFNGPFASVDGLADVAGITPSRLDALASVLTVGR
jgi:competence protein ComEA